MHIPSGNFQGTVNRVRDYCTLADFTEFNGTYVIPNQAGIQAKMTLNDHQCNIQEYGTQ